MLPLQIEQVAEEKIRSWEKQARQRQLLQQIPQRPSLWSRWLSATMVLLGRILLNRGQQLAHQDQRQTLSSSPSQPTRAS